MELLPRWRFEACERRPRAGAVCEAGKTNGKTCGECPGQAHAGADQAGARAFQASLQAHGIIARARFHTGVTTTIETCASHRRCQACAHTCTGHQTGRQARSDVKTQRDGRFADDPEGSDRSAGGRA